MRWSPQTSRMVFLFPAQLRPLSYRQPPGPASLTLCPRPSRLPWAGLPRRLAPQPSATPPTRAPLAKKSALRPSLSRKEGLSAPQSYAHLAPP
jgi:hypothetical protein